MTIFPALCSGNLRATQAITLALVLLSQAGFPAVARAEESILLDNGVKLSGTLLKWDDREVTIRLGTGLDKTYPLSRVKEVNAEFSKYHKVGIDMLAQNRFDDAIRNLKYALEEETRTRPWAAQRIQLSLLEAHLGQGNLDQAGDLFLNIAKRRTDLNVMALAPLLWYTRTDLPKTQVESNYNKARAWLARDDNLAKLLACSWLIGSTKDEGTVASTLKKLEIVTDPRINSLARVQHWRLKAKSAKPDDVEILRKTVRRIPPGLRAGPKFVLGDAYRQAGNPSQAALEYLWVPFVYGKDAPMLAGEATWRAAQAAEAAKMSSDAIKLYQSIVKKHPKSSWAQKAKQRLENLSSKSES